MVTHCHHHHSLPPYPHPTTHHHHPSTPSCTPPPRARLHTFALSCNFCCCREEKEEEGKTLLFSSKPFSMTDLLWRGRKQAADMAAVYIMPTTYYFLSVLFSVCMCVWWSVGSSICYLQSSLPNTTTWFVVGLYILSCSLSSPYPLPMLQPPTSLPHAPASH